MDGQEDVIQAFRQDVNMSAAQLERWLETDESKAAGQRTDGRGESTGHASGRRIVQLLRHDGEYKPPDIAHMRKVSGYIARHVAQRPEGDVRDTRWRHSLMNWGHYPLKR